MPLSRAREIVGFASSGPIFETENRFISRPEAEKSVHKTLYFSRFCNIQTDIVTCQNCSHLIDLFHIVSAHAYIGHVARYFPIIGETLQRWGKRILSH